MSIWTKLATPYWALVRSFRELNAPISEWGRDEQARDFGCAPNVGRHG